MGWTSNFVGRAERPSALTVSKSRPNSGRMYNMFPIFAPRATDKQIFSKLGRYNGNLVAIKLIRKSYIYVTKEVEHELKQVALWKRSRAKRVCKWTAFNTYKSTVILCTKCDSIYHEGATRWRGQPSQYKDCLSRYGDFHYKDKTVVRPSYFYNGNSYTGKKISLYWDALQPPAPTPPPPHLPPSPGLRDRLPRPLRSHAAVTTHPFPGRVPHTHSLPKELSGLL